MVQALSAVGPEVLALSGVHIAGGQGHLGGVGGKGLVRPQQVQLASPLLKHAHPRQPPSTGYEILFHAGRVDDPTPVQDPTVQQ